MVEEKFSRANGLIFSLEIKIQNIRLMRTQEKRSFPSGTKQLWTDAPFILLYACTMLNTYLRTIVSGDYSHSQFLSTGTKSPYLAKRRHVPGYWTRAASTSIPRDFISDSYLSRSHRGSTFRSSITIYTSQPRYPFISLVTEVDIRDRLAQ